MTLQDVVKTGKPFKRRHWNKWFNELVDYELNSGNGLSLKGDPYYLKALTKEDILADDWVVNEEKWFENLSKKYPNGVLCWVWVEETGTNEMKVVVEKVKDGFLTLDGECYKDAIPIKKHEAPAILISMDE